MSPTIFLLGFYCICMFVLVVLWFQSGLDKVTDFKGNLSWLQSHFSKSFLKGSVTLLLVVLTILELSAGISSLLAILEVLILKTWRFPFVALGLSLTALATLFAGQRIAKDYAGAASLMGYLAYVILLLILTVITLIFTSNEQVPFTVYPFNK